MDQERERIQDDLRGLIDGDVRCDELFLQLYASDASIYEIKPLAVVRPRHTKDVVTCVEYAAENNLPVLPRGAGTGLAGESLGEGIVVDFSRFMSRILEDNDDTVRLQPGVVHALLNRHLQPSGRVFGPDPATSSVTTMGSVLAIDGAGSHWLRYGSARQHVKSLQVVLADGTLVELGNEPINGTSNSQPRRSQIVREVSKLLQRDADLIQTFQPDARVNRSGYGLRDVMNDGHLNLARLLVGSEGTLALITEATVAVQRAPAHRGVALLLFDRLEDAAQSVGDVLLEGPSACDLMDRRHISLARDNDVRFDLLLPEETEALLLVEFASDDSREVREKLQATSDRLRRKRRLVIASRIASDQEDVELYWQLARKVVPTLYRLKGSSRPLPVVEDIAVPPDVLPDFLTRMYDVLKRHQVIASLFGHAGHGQLHLRPFLDLSERADVERMERLAGDLYAEALDLGGTISGEHGDGLSRTQFLRQQYGPLYDTFCELKQIFDPQNILNPGKKISDVTDLLTRNLRPVTIAPSVETNTDPSPSTSDGPFPLQLMWDADEIAHAARNCNGCGACRSLLPEVRMCPIFRFAPREEASPRAKANLLRGILTGRLSPEIVATEEFKNVADLCVNCHQCRLECPATVDIPKLMVEAKAAYVSINGLRPTDWFMCHLDLLGAIGSMTAPLANWAIGNRVMRWMIEKVLGVSQGRKLPRFARQTFLRQAARRRLTRADRGSGMRVLYFVDIYANYFDTELAKAFVAVMEHNGVSVYVHPGQYRSGMAMVTHGVVDKARGIAARNVEILADAVRQGYQIVATEPAAASCLVNEYPNLIDDDDARLVAENTSEACAYLWKLHQTGRLRLDLKPINQVVAYHEPCHVRSLQARSAGENLMRLIPGITVIRLEHGCSGMAGTFGLRRENYRSSLRAGFELITAMRAPRFQVGATECSACKIQMEQGTNKPTIHPIKILARSYGLSPDHNPFAARSQKLTVSDSNAHPSQTVRSGT